MKTLSKSRLLDFQQCPKRLWLQLNKPDLQENSSDTERRLESGHKVGEIARTLYDPERKGTTIDPIVEGFQRAIERSAALMAQPQPQPIFEAGFAAAGALSFADVMLPVHTAGKAMWRMVEVKSSTSIKPYHKVDASIQAYIARAAGVPLVTLSVAHIDGEWTYPGNGDYRGLLREHDLSAETAARESEVRQLIAAARQMAQQPDPPAMRPGPHCEEPFACGFSAHCRSALPRVEHPADWLPRIQKQELRNHIADGALDMRDVPDRLLNKRQQRVKEATLSGNVFFDAKGSAEDLSGHSLPAYFLDFETIQFAVPHWKGTRPYQQIPFQFSVHRLDSDGRLLADAFLDLTGGDPSRAFAEALIKACGERGPVFVYNAGFETARMRELGERFPVLSSPLQAITARVVDLMKIAQKRYYHPLQQGSWSIKKVLPAIAPELRYDALEGVQNGGLAMEAYLEALQSSTTASRKEQLRRRLLEYCSLDTFAMVRIWQHFSGHGTPYTS